jgi:hypothetical protein
LLHIKQSNSLLFTAGATRPDGNAFDHPDTWELPLDNVSIGWGKRMDIPYEANHVSHVTALYEGKQRHYVAGGQLQQDEYNRNQADHFEWDSTNKQWIRRASLPVARGHATASTVPYGCGYMVAGGAINGGIQTSDISYYSIDTDTWTSIGNLVHELNSPVCDIVHLGQNNDWLYCQTGPICCDFSWRIRITL